MEKKLLIFCEQIFGESCELVMNTNRVKEKGGISPANFLLTNYK